MSRTAMLTVDSSSAGRSGESLTPEEAQAHAADDTWRRGSHVGSYANRTLRPAEVMLLVEYRQALTGRVLEIGCGAGRVIGYVIALGGAAEGIDVSERMVEYCRRAYPAGHFSQGDLRDLSARPSGSFDVVLAPNAVLDVVSDAERQRALDDIHRLLAPGGLLILSSHNRAYEIVGPLRLHGHGLVATAAALLRTPRRLRNRRALRRYEGVREDYAILNDGAHDYSVLHYYISRDAQERQLSGHGFELVQCTDLDGVAVPPGEHAAGSPELHYVARRR